MRFAFALIALGLVSGLPAHAQTWDSIGRPASVSASRCRASRARNAENKSRKYRLSGERRLPGHGGPGDLRHEG